MVNRRMRPTQVLTLVRRLAREHGYSVTELAGRGKGSHRVYVLTDSSGATVGRLSVTDHPRDLSWTVLRDVEGKLAHLFGEKWTEKKR